MDIISSKEEKLIRDIRRRHSKLDYDKIIQDLEGVKDKLTAWEVSFLESIKNFIKFSEKQKRAIENMYAKYLEKQQKMRL